SIMLKTSKILGLAIATILTASISALTMSSQAFAQAQNLFPGSPNSALIEGEQYNLAGLQTQQGKVLAEQTTKSVLGDVCLSCWNGLAAHETQQGKELAGELGQLGSEWNGQQLDAALGSIPDTTQQANKVLSGELGHLRANLGTGNGLLGIDTTASGMNSHAEGSSTTATHGSGSNSGTGSGSTLGSSDLPDSISGG